ncbi:MAG: PaaI family thioesterase [Pseudomonadota bacterium]
MAGLHPAQELFTDKHPLTAEFNMKFHAVKEHVLEVTLNAPKSFADGDGVNVHPGFHTLILDTVMGASALGELKQAKPIATIKLTSNHIRRIPVGEPIKCRAIWDGEENSIAYVRGEILVGDTTYTASTAIGTFMIGTTSKPLGSKG